MKKNDFKNPRNGILTLLLCMVLGVATAQQDLYVSNGAILHYSGGDFASKEIDNTNGGAFSISSNYVPNDANYVKGVVTINTAGSHGASLGGTTGANSAAARNFSFTTTGLGTAAYNETAVPSGSIMSPAGYTLANAEVYTFTGDVSAASAAPLATTTFGTATGTTIVPVFSTSESGPWVDTPIAGTTTKMTFAKESSTLSTTQFNIENFAFYPNPVTANTSSIKFTVPNHIREVAITLYSATGQRVQQYKSMALNSGVNSINKPQVANGLYFMQFSFNNGEQQIIKKLLIK